MFSAWKTEKATAALVDEAQAVADRLAGAKPHVVDGYAAAARLWEASYLADGQDLNGLAAWPAARVAKFMTAAQTRIAALRKKREYESSDGLAVWLHTARAVAEPRIAPAVRAIWGTLMAAGPNADSMAAEWIAEAGLAVDPGRRAPEGFAPEEGTD